MDLLLRGGVLVLPHGLAKGDLLIREERIAGIESSIAPTALSSGARIVDCAGRLVLPGFIDAHTHFSLGRDEDRTVDGFYEGGAAAAAGGVTTCIDFADQPAGGTLRQGAEQRIAEAGDAVVDFALHQGVYRLHAGLAGELDELAALGVTALKIFTTYKEHGVCLEPAAWPALFALSRRKRLLVTLHAEDDEIIAAAERDLAADPARRARSAGARLHALLRPARAEASAVTRVGLCALRHGAPLYLVHLSSAQGMNAARELRLRGLRLIIETTPHYLLLDEESLAGEDGALFLMTPPLRGAADRAVLKDALCAGEIEVLATDHCAYTPARKKRDSDCRRVPAGVPGIGEAAALLYTLLPGDAAAKALTLAAVFSMNPARFFGLSPRKGSLKPGADGDVVVFDPRAYGVISKSSLRTAAGYSPYEGFRIEGRPVMTILRGRVIAEDGEFTGTRGFGRFVPCGASAAFRGAT